MVAHEYDTVKDNALTVIDVHNSSSYVEKSGAGFMYDVAIVVSGNKWGDGVRKLLFLNDAQDMFDEMLARVVSHYFLILIWNVGWLCWLFERWKDRRLLVHMIAGQKNEFIVAIHEGISFNEIFLGCYNGMLDTSGGVRFTVAAHIRHVIACVYNKHILFSVFDLVVVLDSFGVLGYTLAALNNLHALYKVGSILDDLTDGFLESILAYCKGVGHYILPSSAVYLGFSKTEAVHLGVQGQKFKVPGHLHFVPGYMLLYIHRVNPLVLVCVPSSSHRLQQVLWDNMLMGFQLLLRVGGILVTISQMTTTLSWSSGGRQATDICIQLQVLSTFATMFLAKLKSEGKQSVEESARTLKYKLQYIFRVLHFESFTQILQGFQGKQFRGYFLIHCRDFVVVACSTFQSFVVLILLPYDWSQILQYRHVIVLYDGVIVLHHSCWLHKSMLDASVIVMGRLGQIHGWPPPENILAMASGSVTLVPNCRLVFRYQVVFCYVGRYTRLFHCKDMGYVISGVSPKSTVQQPALIIAQNEILVRSVWVHKVLASMSVASPKVLFLHTVTRTKRDANHLLNYERFLQFMSMFEGGTKVILSDKLYYNVFHTVFRTVSSSVYAGGPSMLETESYYVSNRENDIGSISVYFNGLTTVAVTCGHNKIVFRASDFPLASVRELFVSLRQVGYYRLMCSSWMIPIEECISTRVYMLYRVDPSRIHAYLALYNADLGLTEADYILFSDHDTSASTDFRLVFRRGKLSDQSSGHFSVLVLQLLLGDGTLVEFMWDIAWTSFVLHGPCWFLYAILLGLSWNYMVLTFFVWPPPARTLPCVCTWQCFSSMLIAKSLRIGFMEVEAMDVSQDAKAMCSSDFTVACTAQRIPSCGLIHKALSKVITFAILAWKEWKSVKNVVNSNGSCQSFNTEKTVSDSTIVQTARSRVVVNTYAQYLPLLGATPLYTPFGNDISSVLHKTSFLKGIVSSTWVFAAGIWISCTFCYDPGILKLAVIFLPSYSLTMLLAPFQVTGHLTSMDNTVRPYHFLDIIEQSVRSSFKLLLRYQYILNGLCTLSGYNNWTKKSTTATTHNPFKVSTPSKTTFLLLDPCGGTLIIFACPLKRGCELLVPIGVPPLGKPINELYHDAIWAEFAFYWELYLSVNRIVCYVGQCKTIVTLLTNIKLSRFLVGISAEIDHQLSGWFFLHIYMTGSYIILLLSHANSALNTKLNYTTQVSQSLSWVVLCVCGWDKMHLHRRMLLLFLSSTKFSCYLPSSAGVIEFSHLKSAVQTISCPNSESITINIMEQDISSNKIQGYATNKNGKATDFTKKLGPETLLFASTAAKPPSTTLDSGVTVSTQFHCLTVTDSNQSQLPFISSATNTTTRPTSQSDKQPSTSQLEDKLHFEREALSDYEME